MHTTGNAFVNGLERKAHIAAVSRLLVSAGTFPGWLEGRAAWMVGAPEALAGKVDRFAHAAVKATVDSAGGVLMAFGDGGAKWNAG